MKITSTKILVIAASVSLVGHLVSFGVLYRVGSVPRPEKLAPVRVSVVEQKKPEPPPETPPTIIPPKPPPKKKEEPKKTPTQAPKPKEPPKTEAVPVQGISPDAMVKDGPGLAAPVGNTLLKEDEGKRLRPDEVGKLDKDCSADARLVRDSVETPRYTDDALDAGLQGVFTVDVFVDATGAVLEAEMRKPIGYGMDARVVEAAKKARFIPRQNKVCTPLAGWAEMKFSLIIP